jgi:HD-like signal output (HDOD) protein
MIRILFADDEPPVLDGLRTRLHRQSSRWKMVFVESGSRALTELEREPFDVIVTDMRMPGMDGAELLQIASERWPQTVRIVLSGYAEPEQALRLVPVAHQYLSKPCDAQRLVGAIDRCLELQTLLPSLELRALVGRVRTLPVVPRIHVALCAAASAENINIGDIAELVATDPITAAKTLQLANSAFFRLARPLISIDQAVRYLGAAAIRTLVGSAPVFSAWPERGPVSFINFDELRMHAHTVATAARALAGPGAMSDESELVGLLHDIGYWLLAQECPAQLATAVQLARDEHIPLSEAETRILGASHAHIGAYLLGIWGLPSTIVNAVAQHHTPERGSQPKFDSLAALALAHTLLPTDDTSAFGVGLVPDPRLDRSQFSSLDAPFDWHEAEQRVSGIFDSAEAIA